MISLYAIVAGRPRVPRGYALAKAGGAHVVVRKGAPGEPTSEALSAYDATIRSLDADAVLPFRFGTSVAGEGALRKLLDPLAPAVAQALDRVRGAVQYTHRIYGDPLPPPKRRRGQGPGSAFLAAKLHAMRVPEIAPLLEILAPLVRAEHVERHDRPPLVASVYHLVTKKKEGTYRRRLAEADAGAYRVETSGPWPAYAFAELG